MPPRRPLNPYDLSTWNQGASNSASEPVDHRPPADPRQPVHPSRPARQAHPSGVTSVSGGEARTDDSLSVPIAREADAAVSGGDVDTVASGGEFDEIPEQEMYDPLDLPRDLDTFELARRTINRSRAAARDQGLYPISRLTAKGQATDRSRTSSGFSGARADARDPQSIERTLRKVLGDLGWNEGMSAGRVLADWDEIVGPQVAQHVQPVSLDAGVLVVSASSSAWASQIRMITPQLITTIEEHVGAHVISELRVTGPAAAQRTWKKGRRTVQWRGVRDTYG